MTEKENQIVSFYLEHRTLIDMLSVEQAGKLLKSMFKYIFDGVDTSFEDDTLLNGVFSATKASALRQAKNYNRKQKISKRMLGNQNALKHDADTEPEGTSVDVGEPEDYIQVPEE